MLALVGTRQWWRARREARASPAEVVSHRPAIRWTPPESWPIVTGSGQVDPADLSDWLTWLPTDRAGTGTDGVLSLAPEAVRAGVGYPVLIGLLRSREEYGLVRRGCCGVEVSMADGVSAVYAHLIAVSLLYAHLRRSEQRDLVAASQVA
jgi:hypothetical protein